MNTPTGPGIYVVDLKTGDFHPQSTGIGTTSNNAQMELAQVAHQHVTTDFQFATTEMKKFIDMAAHTGNITMSGGIMNAYLYGGLVEGQQMFFSVDTMLQFLCKLNGVERKNENTRYASKETFVASHLEKYGIKSVISTGKAN